MADPEAARAALVRPLRFAAKHDFANLDRVKGLERAVRGALERAALPAAVRDEVAGLAEGLDAAPLADKRARITRLLARLDADAAREGGPPTDGARSPARPGPEDGSPREGGRSPSGGRSPPVPPVAPVAASGPSPESLALEPPAAKLAKAAPKVAARYSGKRVPMAEADVDTPLVEVVGVGPKTAERLANKGLETVQDALFFLPRRYEDRTRFTPIAELVAGERATVQGEVLAARVRPAGRGKRVFELAIRDDSGALSCRFFRFYQSQMESRYPRGAVVVASGAVSAWGQMRQMVHPELRLPTGDAEPAPEGILPVYGEVEQVPTKKLRSILEGLAQAVAHRVQDFLPDAVRAEHALPRLADAVARAHLPTPEDLADGEVLQGMRRRLVFDELFLLQLALGTTQRRRDAQPGLAQTPARPWAQLAQDALPFELTAAQRRVLGEIAEDMAAPRPMNRLLQGDVGSGKTAVAFVAAAIAWSAGRQAALLAPTEILAAQHFRNAERMLAPLGIRVALLTGSTRASERRWLLSQLRAGALDVLIGTHAILEPAVVFGDLGLAIVDEQHRFGVEQRGALKAKRDAAMPDVLVMTATPIPRTLALTAYGDLRVSTIDALPPGRSPTETRLFGPQQRDRALERLEQELAAGRQAYVVFPLIDASEKLELKAATEEVEGLRARLAGRAVALLHGRMKPEDKAEVMRRFTAGEVDVLVSTTVIEVGVDVANATVMMVENAERFGLSQLHQLRGRVGRGAHRGRCLLVAGSTAGEAMARLAVMEASSNGFEVAERDLEIRGPGEILGTRQSGLPDLVLADVVRDAPTLEAARAAAWRILQADPGLAAPEHAALRAELARRFSDRLDLAEIG